MRLFARVRSLVGANVHALVGKLENPEIMADHELERMADELDKLRQEAAMAFALQRRLVQQINRQRTQAEHWRTQAGHALSLDKEELAKWALGRFIQDQDRLVEMEKQLELVEKTTAKTKEALIQMEAKLAEKRQRRLALLARHRTAKVCEQAQRILDRERFESPAIAARYDRWESRLEESTEILLAMVEVREDDGDMASELVALETDRRINEELNALRGELEFQ